MRLSNPPPDDTPVAIAGALRLIEQAEDLLFSVYRNPAMPESVASIENHSVRGAIRRLDDARRELRRSVIPVHYARTAYTVMCGARDSSSLSRLRTTTIRAEVTCPACVIEIQA